MSNVMCCHCCHRMFCMCCWMDCGGGKKSVCPECRKEVQHPEELREENHLAMGLLAGQALMGLANLLMATEKRPPKTKYRYHSPWRENELSEVKAHSPEEAAEKAVREIEEEKRASLDGRVSSSLCSPEYLISVEVEGKFTPYVVYASTTRVYRAVTPSVTPPCDDKGVRGQDSAS